MLNERVPVSLQTIYVCQDRQRQNALSKTKRSSEFSAMMREKFTMEARILCITWALLAVPLLLINPLAAYKIGVGIADVTGPPVGITFVSIDDNLEFLNTP